ncbi:MAG: nucleoside triphosphate pyrophosphohydrolase [Candidatus Staskawiczbacteria bacterium]|jgi:predicted house-cleaning noncanonical NTP pyrophosphatase (MazG superfamily)
MKYNKLVRDKIPEYIKNKGGNAITHVANDAEYWQKLKEKLQEEINEFMEAGSIEEMADILEVIDAIFDYKKFDKEELQKVKNIKASERGKFKDKIILEES